MANIIAGKYKVWQRSISHGHWTNWSSQQNSVTTQTIPSILFWYKIM